MCIVKTYWQGRSGSYHKSWSNFLSELCLILVPTTQKSWIDCSLNRFTRTEKRKKYDLNLNDIFWSRLLQQITGKWYFKTTKLKWLKFKLTSARCSYSLYHPEIKLGDCLECYEYFWIVLCKDTRGLCLPWECGCTNQLLKSLLNTLRKHI